MAELEKWKIRYFIRSKWINLVPFDVAVVSIVVVLVVNVVVVVVVVVDVVVELVVRFLTKTNDFSISTFPPFSSTVFTRQRFCW